MGIVSAKRTRTRPTSDGTRSSSAPLLRAVAASGTSRVTAKVALKSGSSQQGNALRAKVASIWVVAMTASSPSAAVNVER